MPQYKTTETEIEQHTPQVPGLQMVVTIWGLSLITMVVGTALYGPAENSERAFRLLHWWKRDPEPRPDAQRRSPPAKRH